MPGGPPLVVSVDIDVDLNPAAEDVEDVAVEVAVAKSLDFHLIARP